MTLTLKIPEYFKTSIVDCNLNNMKLVTDLEA